ncbi:MAG: permease, partial [Candidatus Thermoplasmatota archaeon]
HGGDPVKGTENKKMNENMKEKQKKGMIRDLIILGIILIVTVILISLFPDKKEPVISTSWDFFIEMMLILPAVMVILGLFAVFVPKETVVKYFGKTSGIKGIILAIILGALPTGPLYVAFPMAAALLKKGAKKSNIIVFLSAWACIKIPQEMVELQFLGPQFMLLRLSLTVVLVIFMGVSIEKIIEWRDKERGVKNAI